LQTFTPNSIQLGSPQPGTPDAIPPTPTFVLPANPPLPAPASTNLPFSTGLQGKLVFPHRFNRLNALYQIDTSGNSSPVQLLDQDSNLLLTAPVLSPDGKKAAFNYYLGDMFVLDIGSTLPVRISSCGAPSWSPDGSQLICKSSLQASFDILDAQTGALVHSISIDPSARFPTWSPAGDDVAFNRIDSQKNSSIWRLSLSGGGAPVLLKGEASENYAPAWSPDGQWIAFQSNMSSVLSEIWVMDRNGENLRRVVNTPAEFWSRAPAWSPDGQWLAFVSNQAGSIGEDYGEIFVVSLATGEIQQITNTGGRVYDWRVSWSR
jgi:dipeptidyl aminopeptidase/acylaminoacyl peptidase